MSNEKVSGKKVMIKVISSIVDDSLDRRSEAISNFVIPSLSKDRKSIVGLSGREGMAIIMNQLKTDKKLLNEYISKFILKNKKDTQNNIYISNSKNNLGTY